MRLRVAPKPIHLQAPPPIALPVTSCGSAGKISIKRGREREAGGKHSARERESEREREERERESERARRSGMEGRGGTEREREAARERERERKRAKMCAGSRTCPHAKVRAADSFNRALGVQFCYSDPPHFLIAALGVQFCSRAMRNRLHSTVDTTWKLCLMPL